jgi:hypothetical protein
MPAGNQEEEIRKGDIIRQASRQSVRLEMVNRDKRLVGRPCDALRGHGADNQTADQTRACGSSYAIDLGQRDVGLYKSPGDDGIKVIEVGPRRDLRHNSAKGRVLDLLPINLVRPDSLGDRDLGNNRRGGLIAARLNAEDDHKVKATAVRPSISARYDAASGRLAGCGNFIGLERLVGGGIDLEQLDGIPPQRCCMTQHRAAAFFLEQNAVMDVMRKN